MYKLFCRKNVFFFFGLFVLHTRCPYKGERSKKNKKEKFVLNCKSFLSNKNYFFYCKNNFSLILLLPWIPLRITSGDNYLEIIVLFKSIPRRLLLVMMSAILNF